MEGAISHGPDSAPAIYLDPFSAGLCPKDAYSYSYCYSYSYW
jgi:hypothetical protein